MSRHEERAWRLAAAVLLTLLAAGCSPTLPDGEFDCSGGGSCPDGWRCLLDDLCYSPSFRGFDIYAPCEVNTDCASGLCLQPFDSNATGQCSTTCSTSESCPARLDRGEAGSLGGVCSAAAGGNCIAECGDSDDCNANQRCVVVPMTQGETACIDFADTTFSGRQTCMGPNDCEEGLFCLRATALDQRGVCTWPCDSGGNCPPDATCEPLPANVSGVAMNPMQACLATCNTTPGSCGLLACVPFPGTTPHCIPPGWSP